MSNQLAKPCKTSTAFLHVTDRFRRHQLGPLDAEQIGEIKQEKLYAFISGEFCKISRHQNIPLKVVLFGAGNPIGSCQRHSGHRGCLNRQSTQVFGLKVQDMTFATCPRDGLRF